MTSTNPDASSRLIRILVLIIFCSILLTFFYLNSTWHQANFQSQAQAFSEDIKLLVNRSQAPKWNWTNQHKQVIKLAQLKGKSVYINFWAIWCPPCKKELPYIEALAKELSGNDDFYFLAVNMDSSKEKKHEAKNLILQLAPSIDSTFDQDIFKNDLEIQLLPYHILIDKNGAVAGEFYGDILEHQADFERVLKSL